MTWTALDSVGSLKSPMPELLRGHCESRFFMCNECGMGTLSVLPKSRVRSPSNGIHESSGFARQSFGA